MRALLRIAWLTSGILSVIAPPIAAATLDLKLGESLPAPGNNIVQLRPIGANPLQSLTPEDMKTYWSIARTSDSLYTVLLKGIDQFVGNHYFTYEFLIWRNNGSQAATQVEYLVTSTGSFADFFKEMPFTIKDENSNRSDGSTGTINVFFPSLEPAPVCKAVDLPTRAAPLRVFLSGTTEFTIRLNCEDAAGAPRLLAVSGPRGHSDYWSRHDYDSSFYGANAKPLTSKSFDLLTGTLTPNVLAAVGARFRHLSVSDGPDDTIVVDLQYAIPPAGLERPLKIEIPIAFYPFISVIASALSSGVLLGWLGLVLLMVVANKSKPRKTTITALFLGLVLALITFLLVLLAYSANCRLTLFGLEVNPSDVLVLFALGVICGGLALLRAESLLKRIEQLFGKLDWLKAASVLLVIAASATPVEAAESELGFVGLSACPDGNVIGLSKEGWVIHFPNGPSGGWRKAGRLQSSLKGTELNCASIDGKNTALIVALSLERIWLVRMDLATGRWTHAPVTEGTGVGVAFDPMSRGIFVSSIRNRAVYLVSPSLKDVKQWASIFGKSESISSLAIDVPGKRLLVGEAFSGTVYSLALDSRRQDTFVDGMGSVNSLSVDPQRNLLYVADAGRRTIWIAPLAGKGIRTPKSFYRNDELKYVSGVAVDARSNVWVAVQRPAKVTVLSSVGKPIAIIK